MFQTARAIKIMGLALCALSINGCDTPSQTYWDAKVKELCEKDGGVTIYEHIEISRQNYPEIISESGNIIIPLEINSKSNDPFYVSKTPEVLINENPRVWKDEIFVIRRSDHKILGKKIDYARRGGDIPNGISHESSYGCSEVNGIKTDIINKIFTFKGK